jgi:hypothetical protein
MSSFKTVSKRSLTQGGVTVNSFYASAAVPCPTGAFDNTCNANGVYAGCYLTAEYADDRYLIKSRDDTVPEGTTETFQGPVVLNGGLSCNSDSSFNALASFAEVNAHFIDASAADLYIGTKNTNSIVLGSPVQIQSTLDSDSDLLLGANSASVSIGAASTVTTIEGRAVVSRVDAPPDSLLLLGASSSGVSLACPVTIESSLDSAAAMVLGAGSPSVTIGSPLTQTTIEGSTVVSSLDAPAESSLFLGATTSNIHVGSSTTTTTIQGKLVLKELDVLSDSNLLLGKNSFFVNIGSPLTTTYVEGVALTAQLDTHSDSSLPLLLGTASSGVVIGSASKETVIEGNAIVSQLDAPAESSLLLGTTNSDIEIGSQTTTTTINGNTIVSHLDAPLDTPLVLGTNSSGVTIGSYNNTTNFVGNIAYNNVVGTAGQILTMIETNATVMPMWQTLVLPPVEPNSGLTLTQADERYIQKNNAGVINVPVTLTAGLSTSTMSAYTPTSPFNLLTNMSNSLQIGSTTPSSGQTISVGEGSITKVNVGGISCTGSRINALAPTNGTLYLADYQQGGVLNIGTHSQRTGAINIGTESAYSAINIGKSGGAVNILANVVTPNVNASGSLSLGSSSGTTSVNIGRSGIPVNINGTFNLSDVDTTAALSIGAANATSVDIGRAGRAVNLKGNVLASTIDASGTILKLGNSSSTTKTYIGNDSNDLYILSNNCYVDTIQGYNNTLNIGNETSNINIGYGGGSVHINGTCTTSKIDTSGADALYVGPTNATSVSIGRLNHAVNVIGNLTASSLDNSSTLSLGTTSATNVNIGRTGHTINLYAPPTPNYTSAPTIGQIGYMIYTVTPEATITQTNTYVNIASVVLGEGNVSNTTWFIEYQCMLNKVNTNNQNIVISNTINGGNANLPKMSCLTTSSNQTFRLTGMVRVTSGSTMYINIYTSLLNQTLQLAFIQATRIA